MVSSQLGAPAHDEQAGELDDIVLQFALQNDVTHVPGLIAHLQTYIDRLRLFDTNASLRVCIALEEAISNAIHHGNLELNSELREDGGDEFFRLAAERRQRTPYAQRRVYVAARLSPREAVFTVKDEGPGFDPSNLPDPTTPANLTKASGRGLLLIRSFMDAVAYNPQGNELTMCKRRTTAAGEPIANPDCRR